MLLRRWFSKASLAAAFVCSAALVASAPPARAADVVPVRSFTGADGANPQSGVALGPDGALYGVTPNGGVNNSGVVYKVKTDGTYVVLHTFAGPDGANPQGALFPRFTKSGFDAFYGTTSGGGVNGFGTTYKIKADGTFTSLYNFQGGADASNPASGLFGAFDGNLYGASPFGGVNGNGAIYRLTSAGVVTVIYSFSAFDADGFNKDGAFPFASLVLGFDGKLYGNANFGGTGGRGTVFSVTTGGTFRAIRSFSVNDGAAPVGPLLPIGFNTFVGTTSQGGANNSGTIFRFSSSGSFKTLYSFGAVDIFTNTNADGSNPQSGLFPYLSRDPAKCGLYGFAAGAGPNGQGTAYKITLDGKFTVLHGFTGGSDGANPLGTPFIAFDGNLYGTAQNGGDLGFGAIFRLIP